jgi:flavin-dependent dehydrogenase
MVTTTVLDKLTNQTYEIRSRFLFGADGARSSIMKQLDLPLDVKESPCTFLSRQICLIMSSSELAIFISSSNLT